jgi:transcriptional regulator of met regulon
MSSPDPESFSLLAKVITAGGVVATPIVWLWTKLDKKADKHSVNNSIHEMKTEQVLHRTYFANVFEKMEQHARRDEELFREVLTKIGDNHSEIMRELGRKEDRK